MDIRRMSTWNVLSVEAAMQQLNAFEGDESEKIIRRPNTVSHLIFAIFSDSALNFSKNRKIIKLLHVKLYETTNFHNLNTY